MNVSQIYKDAIKVKTEEEIEQDKVKLEQEQVSSQARDAWLESPFTQQLIITLNNARSHFLNSVEDSSATTSETIGRSLLIQSNTLKRVISYVTTGKF